MDNTSLDLNSRKDPLIGYVIMAECPGPSVHQQPKVKALRQNPYAHTPHLDALTEEEAARLCGVSGAVGSPNSHGGMWPPITGQGSHDA